MSQTLRCLPQNDLIPPLSHRNGEEEPGEADAQAGAPRPGVLGAPDRTHALSGQSSAPYLLRMQENDGNDLIRIDDERFVLGRNQQPAVALLHRAVSRLHARIFFQSGNWFLEDLASKNGTLLNYLLVSQAVKLHNDDLINLGNAVVFRFIDDPLADEVYRVRMIAIGPRDPVTNTASCNDFDKCAQVEFSFHAKYDLPLALVVVQADQACNPAQEADVAKEMARRLRRIVRKQDMLCHTGQNCFALLCRRTTRDEAIARFGRLQQEVAQQPFNVGLKRLHLTVSAGVAAIPGHQQTVVGLRSFAQFAIEQAKANGGNQVRTAQ